MYPKRALAWVILSPVEPRSSIARRVGGPYVRDWVSIDRITTFSLSA